LLDEAFQKEWAAHQRATEAEGRGESVAQFEAEAERYVEEAGIFAEQMTTLPATTREGLFAKARAVAWCLGGDDELTFALREEGAAVDERLARSIVRDLLRMEPAELPTNEAQRLRR
jgi:hypothetical protein